MKKIDCVTVGPVQTNCWLYALEGAADGSGARPCAVIDPGDEAGAVISRLQELNWVPRYIFLTHGHFDHVMALPDLLEAFRKGAFAPALPPETGIHCLDAHYLGKDAMKYHRSSFIAAGGNPLYIDTLRKHLSDADILFEEGDDAGPFKVLHLPGHTPGSAGFYDEASGVLFSGDTLFRGNRGRTDLPGGNEAQIRESLTRLLSMKGDIVVCPGHGPATTIEEEAEGFIF
jgi:glyoxylase-like metal-dependent hydrolase (beta-lactamase superfamily II)